MKQNTSFPKEDIKILLLENISDAAAEELREAGYSNIRRLSKALEEAELLKELKDVHLLGIRSKTQLSARVFNECKKLLAVGCYCIGTNQVDLEAASLAGVPVFNAPYSNTRSVAELVLANAIFLIRRIPDKDKAAHQGIWMKESKNCFELRGKTLGIIGYGNIGSQVSVLAEALGMQVFYYDLEPRLPLGNARQVRSLKEMLPKCDIVSLHIPADSTTRDIINAESIGWMKHGAILINCARGEVVDVNALALALQSGRLGGAAVDVFPDEPEKNGPGFESPLRGMPNTILTPHIGGSTEEAQLQIGLDVSSKLLNFLELGITNGSHSVPALSLPVQADTHRILHIHRNMPGVLSEINTKLSEHHINILGQYLKTNERIGYVVLDVDRKLSKEAFALLKTVKETLRLRMVY